MGEYPPANIVIKIITFMKIDRIDRILKRYPLSLIILAAIVYLSFFKPPKSALNEIDNIDKVAHILMYGGFCSVLWFEYFFTHLHISVKRIFWGAIIGPIMFSGAIEIMQEIFTKHRGGDWLDFLFNTMGVIGAALFSVYITKPLMIKYNIWHKNSVG